MAMFKDDSVRARDYQRFEHPTPSWFTAAKLGIFVHWGVYSVPAWAEPLGEFGSADDPNSFAHNPYAEWYANTIRIDGSPAQRHHELTWGGRDYYDLLDEWHAENFDADALMDLVVGAGARYFIPVSKHHDGVTLWDAPGTGSLNTVRRGPRQDLVSRFATAARRAGLRFGVYYSGGLDWNFSRLPPHTEKPAAPGDELPGRPNDRAYAAYAHAQVIDLIERFQPDILWGDIDWPDSGKPPGPFSLISIFDRFYQTVPDGVVNDRWGDTHWDFRTSEYQESPALGSEAWENTRGLGYSFGYNQLETEASTLSGVGAIKHFVDVVSRGGNLLLNIGLMADGSVPALQRQALETMGRWNDRYGAVVFGADRLDDSVGEPSEVPWVRWTKNAGLVAAIFDSPGDRVLLRADSAALDVSSARDIDGASIVARGSDGGVEIHPRPASLPGPRVVVFDLRHP